MRIQSYRGLTTRECIFQTKAGHVPSTETNFEFLRRAFLPDWMPSQGHRNPITGNNQVVVTIRFEAFDCTLVMLQSQNLC